MIVNVIAIFTFSTEMVFAKPVIHRVSDATKKESNYETKYCNFPYDPASTVRVRIETGGTAKKGLRYKISDSDGHPLFCVTPNINIAQTYNRGDYISSNDSVGQYFYKAYKYYLDNIVFQSSLAYTQAAFWYFYQTSYDANKEITREGLSEAILTFFMTSECSNYEERIRQFIENDKFTCSDFMNEKSIEGYYAIRNPKGELKKSSNKRMLSLEDYMNLFALNAIETRDKTGDSKILYDVYKTAADSIAGIIMNYDKYAGDLYYWKPVGRGQLLIGIYGCPPSDVKKQCPKKIDELKKEYPNESQRTISNTAYYNKLKDILKGELNVSQEALNDPTFVANPKCSSKPEGSDCPSDLAILQSYEGDPTKQTEYYALLEQMKINYPDEFSQNGKDYACGPIDEPQTCDPEYEDNDCSFDHTERTLYMKDSSSKACWNERQIAYKTDDAIVSSVFEGVSPYCTVTCHELFQVDFPPGKDNIKAGEEFFWGFGEPGEAYFGNVNASKNCYTSYPNYNQFLADWNANEEKIKQAYADYLAQKSYNSQSDSDVKEVNGHCCTSGYTAPHVGDWTEVSKSKCISEGLACRCSTGIIETAVGQCEASGGHWEYQPTVAEDCSGGWGKTYKLDAKSETYNGKTGTSTSKTSGCVASKPEAKSLYDTTTEDSRLDSLNNLIKGRSTLKSNLEKCYSNSAINENTIYHNVTNIKLTYTDPANTNRNIDGATLINKDNWSSFNSYGVVEQGGTITLNCSDTPGVSGGDTCGNVIQKYIEYYWDFVGLWKYYYNTEIFSWKFLLENGHAVNIKKFDESYSSFHNADGTVGFIASFKLITGFYEFAKVDVQGFGSDGHFNELYRSENEGSDIYTYSCPFKVTNEIYGSECRFDCDYNAKTCKITADSPAYCKTEVKGLDVVYRIIELTSAEKAAAGNIDIVFPGIVGTGRKLGKNWNDFYTNNRTKYNNITTYNNVYDGGPIYTIDLTPALIQEIRADNATYRNHKDGETNKPMDPYTSMKYTNGTKKYLCSDDTPTNQTCASEWLSSLSQRGLLTGEYGEIKDTKARLEAIRKAKDSTEASGTKNVTVVGGA